MDTLTTIATRRSTRVYKPEQISDSQLQTILAAGWASPVGHGAYSELYISVVQNPKILEAFAEYCGQAFGNPKYNPFYGAPTLIVVSAKPKADGQLVYIADVGCILENMQLAATGYRTWLRLPLGPFEPHPPKPAVHRQPGTARRL